MSTSSTELEQLAAEPCPLNCRQAPRSRCSRCLARQVLVEVGKSLPRAEQGSALATLSRFLSDGQLIDLLAVLAGFDPLELEILCEDLRHRARGGEAA